MTSNIRIGDNVGIIDAIFSSVNVTVDMVAKVKKLVSNRSGLLCFY